MPRAPVSERFVKRVRCRYIDNTCQISYFDHLVFLFTHAVSCGMRSPLVEMPGRPCHIWSSIYRIANACHMHGEAQSGTQVIDPYIPSSKLANHRCSCMLSELQCRILSVGGCEFRKLCWGFTTVLPGVVPSSNSIGEGCALRPVVDTHSLLPQFMEERNGCGPRRHVLSPAQPKDRHLARIRVVFKVHLTDHPPHVRLSDCLEHRVL